MQLPDGITLRAWRRDDLAAMAELINQRVGVEGIGEFATADVMAEVYDHLHNCDPATDLVVAVDERGAVVGYARTLWAGLAATGRRNYYCAFEADLTVDGLAASMLAWGIARNREIGAAHTATSAPPGQVLAAHATEGTHRADVLEAAGLTQTSWGAYMGRPIVAGEIVEPRPLPTGLEVRPVQPDDLRAIWAADIDAFRDDRDFIEPDETSFDRFVAEAEGGTELWQVAWDGDRVAGQVRTHVTPGESERRGRRRAWTENISTAKEWRKRGVASALITASLRQLAEFGYEEACLGVDLDNPNDALGLYESLGYRVIARGGEWTAPLA